MVTMSQEPSLPEFDETEFPNLRVVSVIHDPEDVEGAGEVKLAYDDDLGDYEVLGLLVAGLFRHLLYVCDANIEADSNYDDE
jgi:hypothetical protein